MPSIRGATKKAEGRRQKACGNTTIAPDRKRSRFSLGKPENGFWSVTAADAKARTSRQYLDHSPILETQFQTASGVVSLTDQ